jgi:hypothetical protein
MPSPPSRSRSSGPSLRPGDRGHAGVFTDHLGRDHRCDSKLEMQRARVLDLAGYRLSRATLRIPYLWKGRKHIYKPDWIVFYPDGRVAWVEEDKPTIRVQDALNQAKFAAAKRWCNQQGWRFRVVTERTLRRTT